MRRRADTRPGERRIAAPSGHKVPLVPLSNAPRDDVQDVAARDLPRTPREASQGAARGDAAAAEPFANGLFATVYLSPRDYHRVHMPWSGTLRETVHVPGRLFSVGPAAVAHVPRLFARNERLVCHFDTDFGPMVQVMVGALLVSGVETVWSGEEIPAYGDRITRKDWRGKHITLDRFAEMARFNYGSTVIVLLPPGVAEFDPALQAESPVQLGQMLARLK